MTLNISVGSLTTPKSYCPFSIIHLVWLVINVLTIFVDYYKYRRVLVVSANGLAFSCYATFIRCQLLKKYMSSNNGHSFHLQNSD